MIWKIFSSLKHFGFASIIGNKSNSYFSIQSHTSRRLKRIYDTYWFWLLGITAMATVLIVTVIFQSMLINESRSVAQNELNQLADNTILRIERRLNQTLSVLRELAQNGKTQCGGSTMLAYAEAAKGQAAITRISLISASGHALCSTAPNRNSAIKLLPKHQNTHPRASLVQPDPRSPQLIVVSWHVSDGMRLAALIDGEGLELDAHPIVFAGQLFREINLNTTTKWIADGVPLDPKSKANALSAEAQGQRFPIIVRVIVPDSILRSLNLVPKITVPIIALILLIVVTSTVLKLNQTIAKQDETSIELALDDGQIQPLYQPLIDLTSGRVLGAEILMRWIKKDGTVARPGDFIHRVEQAGLTCELTVSLLNSAIEELGETYREMPSMTLSINLFPGDIKDYRIVQMVDDTMANRSLRSEQIIFEVTERRGLEDIDDVQDVLNGLSKLGARIALDNAGAGHLGLSGLKQLWPDVVKIDKVLVDALGREDNARSIIDTIVSLADELAIGIVAEGVENIDQMQRLNAIGVTAAQGYLFSKPLPADEFKEFLNQSINGELNQKLEELKAAQQAA